METDVERANVRESVMDCLANIVDDFEHGIEPKAYLVFVPLAAYLNDEEIGLSEHNETIIQPRIVYRSIVLNGKDPVADYLTGKIMRKIYGKGDKK